MEKTVKKRMIIEKEILEIFINGKNTVTVLDMNEFKGHSGSTFHSPLF